MREMVFVRCGKGKKSKEISFVFFTHFRYSLCTSPWPPQFPEVWAVHSPSLNEEERKIPLIPQTSLKPYSQPTIPTNHVTKSVLPVPPPPLPAHACSYPVSPAGLGWGRMCWRGFPHYNLPAPLLSVCPCSSNSSPTLPHPLPSLLFTFPPTHFLFQPTLLQYQFSVGVES